MRQLFTDPVWWFVFVTVVITAYVQCVGWHVENISGRDRLGDRFAYRFLFGGAPWLQWVMFRFGGLIVTAGLISFLVLYGWWRGALSILIVALSPVVFWRIARGHAMTMLEALDRRLREEPR